MSRRRRVAFILRRFVIALTIACAVCVACVLASLRRLREVLTASHWDLEQLAERARAGDLATIAAVLHEPAPAMFDAGVRAALLSEDMYTALIEPSAELEFQLARSARVPIICARIASTTGFLAASWRLREGLKVEYLTDADTLEIILRGVDMVALGFCAALICVAVQRVSRSHARQLQRAADAFVDALSAAGDQAAASLTGDEPAGTSPPVDDPVTLASPALERPREQSR